MSFSFGLDQIRTVLHLLGVTVWVGGQILMMGLLPVLKKIGGDAPSQAAAAFGRVAWSAFGLIVVTGIWNIFEIEMGEATSGYNAGFLVKLLLVALAALATAAHQRTEKPSVRGMTAAVGFVASVVVLALGIALGH